jgi:2'-hydroxyisoflavone reductase
VANLNPASIQLLEIMPMPSRREFLLQAAGALAASKSETLAASTERALGSAASALNVLILGATGFIGPHFVRAAVERGHRVSIFTRGKDHADLPASVASLIGDRNSDLESIKNRDWDAVFDLATYIPIWVRTLGKALVGRVRHYTLISSEMVYQYPGAIDEKSAVQKYTGTADPYSLTESGDQYGELKVLCEQEAERQFPGRTLVLRPGAIVGPGDDRNPAHIYWPVRMKQGGEILVPGDPFARVQMIDVRDLAEWAMHMAESSQTGIFNSIGPAMPMGWAEMLGGVRSILEAPMELAWVPIAWLAGQKMPGLDMLQFWPTEAGVAGLMHMANEKARNHGLTFRPWGLTAADILAWYEAQPTEWQKKLLSIPNDISGLSDLLVHEREVLRTWRTRKI